MGFLLRGVLIVDGIFVFSGLLMRMDIHIIMFVFRRQFGIVFSDVERKANGFVIVS